MPWGAQPAIESASGIDPAPQPDRTFIARSTDLRERATRIQAVLAFGLGLLAIGATVGVRLEESGDLPLETALAVTRALARAIEERTQGPVVIDDPVWSACPTADRCIAQARARTRADELVLLRVYGGLTVMRVVIERFAIAGAPEKIELDLAQEPSEWDWPLGQGAAKLFPAGAGASAGAPVLTPPPPQNERRIDPVPWIIVGGSAIAAAAAVGFGLSSRSARVDSQGLDLSDAQFDRFADRTQHHAIAANVLWVTAGIGLATGVAWWVFE